MGLAALCAFAIASLRGELWSSRWGVRATMAIMMVAVVSSLSSVFSIHRGKSLESMLNLLGTLGLFLVAALLLRRWRGVRFVAIAEVVAALPVAIYGIIQHLRPELVADTSYPGRSLGPFGQPNRLGGFLIASIPLAVALLFTADGRWARIALLAAILILTTCLVSTYSRGAWIGFAAGLGVLALAAARTPELRSQPYLLGLAFAALLVPALFAIPSVLARLAPRVSDAPAWNLPFDPEREGSGAMRRAVWSGAIAAATSRPVFGWGLGAFHEGFDRTKSATMKRLEAEGGRTADQAHSYYLQTLAERGVLGLAAFLIFAGVILAGGLAALGTGAPADVRLLSAGLLASLVALLAHAVLEDNLSFLAHSTLLATNAGLLAAAAPGPKQPMRRLASLSALGVVVAVVAMGASVLSASAAFAAWRGDAAVRAGSADAAYAHYAKAARLARWQDVYAINAAKAALATGRLEEAAAFDRQAIHSNPSDPVTRHELARLYLANPNRFGEQGIQAAVSQLQVALAQNPYYAEIQNDLGVALLRSGDRAGARAAFETAAQGRRAFVDPLLNLAALAFERGDRAEAARRIEEALARDPGSERALAMREELAGTARR